MAIDASIALGVKPVQIESPLNQMANVYALQNAQQSNQLNQMKMEEYKRGLSEDEAVKNYFVNTKREDPNFAQGLYGISPKTGQAYEKFQVETGKEKQLSEKARIEGLSAKKGFLQDALRSISKNPSNENIIAYGQDAVLNGIMSAEEAKANVDSLLNIPVEQRQSFLSSQGAKPSDLMTKPSNLTTLQTELNALPLKDPRRKQFEDAIRKETLNSDMQSYESAKLEGYKGSLFDFKRDLAKAGSASTKVVLPEQEKEFEKALGKGQADKVLTSKASAEDAAQILATNKVAKDLLDKGMITGTGADFFVGLNKALNKAGIDFGGADAAANSQAYGGLMATNTAKIIKNFGAGTGLSDADRAYALKAAAGDINMDEKAIRRLIDINNEAAQNAIKLHNKNVSGIKTNIPLSVNPADYSAGIPEGRSMSSAKRGQKTLDDIFK